MSEENSPLWAQQKLQAALQINQLGLWEYHAEGDLALCDARSLELLRLDASEALTLDALCAALHPDARPKLSSVLSTRQPPHPQERFELRLQLIGDKAPRWVLARGQRVEAPGGATRMLGTLQDITTQLEDEEAKRQAESLMHLIERAYRVEDLNEAMRLLCESATESFKLNAAVFFLYDSASGNLVASHSYGVPEGFTPLTPSREVIRLLHLQHGPVMAFSDLASAAQLPARDYLLRAGMCSLASAAVYSDGSVIGLLNVASFGRVHHFSKRDLMQLKNIAALASGILAQSRLFEAKQRAEHLMLDSERRYQEIVEAITEGISITNPERYFTFTNRAFEQMLGYEPGELRGVPSEQIFFDADREPMQKLRQDLFTNPVLPRRALRLRSKAGREVWSSSSMVLLRDGKRLRGILGLHTDITESRKIEQKMLHAQKLESLGVLAGGIAHDFNNLLVGILGNAGLALLEMPAASQSRVDIESIQTAAVRASELTKQLLAYAGRGRFVLAEIDLGRLVEEMGHLLAAVIPKNVLLKYHFAANLPTIEGDPTQLRQVVMNLITNAADAISDKSGIITISTNIIDADQAYLTDAYLDDTLPAGYYVSLEVSDTGAGMSPETRGKIFDPFFTTKFTGRGLGLAAVLGILRAHKGAIKVYSELGRGTTFKVLFPVLNNNTSVSSFSPSLPPHEEWSGEGTVLVVDDEESVRNVLKRVIGRLGFRVLAAEDGVQGLELFTAHQAEIRLVMLDVTMPRMGGEETFRRLRQLDPDVKVLLSSGYSEQEATSRFAGKGLAGFIEKPFKVKELSERLRALIVTPQK